MGFFFSPIGNDPKIEAAAFLLTVGSFLLTVELFDLQLPTLAFLSAFGAFLLTVGKCV